MWEVGTQDGDEGVGGGGEDELGGAALGAVGEEVEPLCQPQPSLAEPSLMKECGRPLTALK